MKKIHLPFLGKLVLLCCVFYLMLGLLASCTTTKHVVTTKSTVDSSSKVSLRDSLHLLQVENNQLTIQVEEMRYAGVVFDSTKCPSLPKIDLPPGCNDSTLRASVAKANKRIDEANAIIQGQRNKIKILTDGTIIASGNIKSANVQNEKQSQINSQKQKVIDSLRLVNAIKETQLIKFDETKKVDKKSSFFGGLSAWLLLIGIVIGCILWATVGNKIYSFFKPNNMKKVIGIILCCMSLTSCAKFHDTNVSIWAEGMWIVPLLTAIAAVICFFITWKKSKSGSEQSLQGGGFVSSKENVPFYKISQFWYGVVFTIASVVIIIVQYGSR